jgi:hypothetical protein
MRQRDGNPPEMRPLGLKSIYRVFGSARYFRGEHTSVVLPH